MDARTVASALIAALLTCGCQTYFLRRGPVSTDETRAALARVEESSALDAAVAQACRAAVAAHPGDLPDMDHIWAAVLDLSDPQRPALGQWRGYELVYPASVIKVVYMAHVYRKVVDGDLRLTRRLKKLVHEMVVPSSNRATQQIVDLLSGTTDGPRIEDPTAWSDWVERREGTDRYMRSLGLTHIVACQKTWDNLPGEDSRELQFLGAEHPMGFVNGNRLCPVETAELLWLIDENLIVSRGACKRMRALLLREPGAGQRVVGDALRAGTRVWAKGGWTDRWFHDASLVHLPDGRRYAIAVFTDMPARQGIDRKAVLQDWTRTLMGALQSP
jgi:beta-lactamase class A